MIFVYSIPPGTTTRGLKQNTPWSNWDWGCPLATTRMIGRESRFERSSREIYVRSTRCIHLVARKYLLPAQKEQTYMGERWILSTRELLIVDETIGEIEKAGGNPERVHENASRISNEMGRKAVVAWQKKNKTKVTNELANEFANRPVRFKHRGNYHPDFLIRPLCPSSSIQTRVQKSINRNEW